ncbi:MAG: dipeptide epimerase [Gemmatimonadaceae bacterium]|nr:dipeptide epimerase [Gemmatimonadaceae bacterium]
MLDVTVETESWELVEAFEIARGTLTALPVIVVTLRDADGHEGRAEAAGVDYDGETPASMMAEIERVQSALTAATRDGQVTSHVLRALQTLLPPGGARNALDCALWDLRAKQTGVPAWRTAALASLTPLTTVFTLGLGSEADTRRKAREARHFPLLKLKCDRDRHVDVVRWVREEHPHARIAVDANQSWTRELLERILPHLASLGVEMVEQPVPRGEDAALDGLRAPVPLAADESCTDRASVARLVEWYQYINIKLDKCGGLTEALAMGDQAIALGMQLMVGNMCGTSLGMAPAFLVGQRCGYVDLDGPLLQKHDREHAMVCVNGVMQPPTRALWG